MKANRPPGLSQRRTSAEERHEPGARDVAQPEAREHGIDLAIRLGPGVAHVDVRPQAVGHQAVACPIEGRGVGVVDRQLALAREERRPPAGPGGELHDLAAGSGGRPAIVRPCRARRSRPHRGSRRARSGRGAGTSRRTRRPGRRSTGRGRPRDRQAARRPATAGAIAGGPPTATAGPPAAWPRSVMAWRRRNRRNPLSPALPRQSGQSCAQPSRSSGVRHVCGGATPEAREAREVRHDRRPTVRRSASRIRSARSPRTRRGRGSRPAARSRR